MTFYEQFYTPSNPGQIIGASGNQQFLIGSNHSFISNKLTTLNPIDLYCRDSVDSGWYSGNIYLANHGTGIVKKTDKYGNELATLSLTSPSHVSVIQNSKRAASGNEIGCWIIDNTENKIYKTDENLTVEYHADGLLNPVALVTNVDGGCFIADDQYSMIIRMGSNGDHLAYILYSSFSPAISNSNKIAAIKTDYDGNLIVLSTDYLYKISFSDDGLVKQEYNCLLSLLAGNGNYAVSALDVDRWSQDYTANESSSSFSVEPSGSIQNIYVAMGNYTNTKICKFNSLNGTLINSSVISGAGYPYIMKIGQGRYSDAIFLLKDNSHFIEPPTPWSSSSSTSSSSSITPGTIFATNDQSTKLYRISTDDYQRRFDSNHIIYGSRAIAYDPLENRLYYISETDYDAMFYYNFSDRTNYYIGNAPESDMWRISMSPDGDYLWLSNGSKFWICNKNNGSVLHIMNILDSNNNPISAYGGMEIHPINQDIYLCSGEAIYRIPLSSIFIGAGIIIAEKIVNKPAITTNYLTDISFSDDGTMYVSDFTSPTVSRLFRVNYGDDEITYTLLNTYQSDVVYGMASGVGIYSRGSSSSSSSIDSTSSSSLDSSSSSSKDSSSSSTNLSLSSWSSVSYSTSSSSSSP